MQSLALAAPCSGREGGQGRAMETWHGRWQGLVEGEGEAPGWVGDLRVQVQLPNARNPTY